MIGHFHGFGFHAGHGGGVLVLGLAAIILIAIIAAARDIGKPL